MLLGVSNMFQKNPLMIHVSPHQWPFQEPKLEVPNIYKAYKAYVKGIYPYGQYLHFRMLEFPLTSGRNCNGTSWQGVSGLPRIVLELVSIKVMLSLFDILMFFLGGRAQSSRTAEVADSWTNPATGLIGIITGILKAHMKK